MTRDDPSPPTPASPDPTRPPGPRLRRPIALALLAAALLGLGLWGAAEARAGWGWHHGGPPAYGPGRGHGHGTADAPALQAWLAFRSDRLLHQLDADPEQRERVQALLEAALAEEAEGRPQRPAWRAALLAELSAGAIDRDAVEALRAEQLAHFDRRSRHWLDTLVEVAEVLTPGQRLRLAELVERHPRH